MRLIIVAATAAVILTGCVSAQQRAYEEKHQTVDAWVRTHQDAVSRGEVKTSVYYTQMYDVLSTPPVSSVDLVYMREVNGLIASAKEMEAGKISADEFASRRRLANINIKEQAQEIRAQAAQAEQERRRAALSAYMQMRPVTTNCYGNRFSASCTTY